MADGEIFKNLGATNLSGFQEFYTTVLYNGANNFFTPRNKAKLSWQVLSDEILPKGYTRGQKGVQVVNGTPTKILQKGLNATAYYVESINLPDTAIKTENFINDGRGAYLPNSEEMEVPTSQTFSIAFKEQMFPEAMMIIDMWIRANAVPFIRPVLADCYVDHISDRDGKNIVVSTRIMNCRPLGFSHISFKQDNREIMLRTAVFGADRIVDSYTTGSGSNQKQQNFEIQTNSDRKSFTN